MYEVAIIGAGAAGIEAAKKSLKHKLKTIIIEKNFDNFGGICLNKGCIPTKLYLSLSKSSKNLETLYEEKNRIVNHIKKATIPYLEKLGLEILWGEARFIDNHRLNIGAKEVVANNIIIATGSSPKEIMSVDNKKILFAEDIFSLSQLPHKFLIIGGGSIGLEMACFLNQLYKDVLVIEKEEEILPGFDRRVVQRLKSILERKGIKIKTTTSVPEHNLDDFDMVLLAAGRVPNTEGLGLEELGIKLTIDKRIKTDDFTQTSQRNIYACGDAASSKMLAYIAEYQARICIENILGERNKCDYQGIPECVFTMPQIACVGVNEEQAKTLNLDYKVIRSNFAKFSSAFVQYDTDGFIKVIIDNHDIILGATIISNLACELISFFSLAIRCNLSIDKLKNCIFIHPTLSEIIPSLLRE